MLLGVFGAFGSGKTLYLVRKAAEAMNKCINCPKDTYPHMKHMHQTLRLKDGTLVKGKCTRMIPSEDRNGRPYHCPCTGFKPVRVLSNLNIKGAEQIGLPEFHNILTEDEVREYENEPEFMRLQNSRDDKRTDADIVTKFENAGFIVIHRDEIALVIIDEAWTWMDARMSGSQQNRAADVVILQSRKKSIDIAYCFDPETIILGDNKKASEYKVGDYVLGKDGLQKVTQTHVFDSALVEVKGQGLLPIRVTPNHPFWVQKSKTNKHRQISGFREPVWKLAQDLIPKEGGKIGDYLTIPRLQGIYETLSIDLRPYTKDVKITPHTTRLDFPLSYDTAWLLGAYVAEGHTTESNNIVTFSLSEDEPQFTQRIMSILKDLGYSAWIQHDKRSKGLQLHFKSRILTKAFRDWCGQGTHNKKIPEFILLHKDTKILKAFLEGYAEGDGCKQNTGWTSLHTVSKLLALQLQLAHARLGIFYGIVESDTTGQSHLAKDGHLIKGGISYQLNSYETAWQVKIFPDKILVPVRSVKQIATKVPVINLETEDHTILANNSLSHNSAQLPSSTDKRLRLNTEVAVIAKKIKKNRKVVAFRYVTASDTKCQVYRLPIEKAETYYTMYSTRESINRPMMFDEELNFRIRFLMEAVKKRKQRNLRDYQRMVLQTQKDAIERMQAADESLEDSKKGTGPATSLLEIQPKNYPVKAEPLPEITPVAPNAEVEYADEKHYDET